MDRRTGGKEGEVRGGKERKGGGGIINQHGDIIRSG